MKFAVIIAVLIRVLLPEGESSIRSIGLTGANGGPVKAWHFSKKQSQR